VDLDYSFGLPFEIKLTSDERGGWHVVFFQSHAFRVTARERVMDALALTYRFDCSNVGDVTFRLFQP
jgi:hypothetical protein